MTEINKHVTATKHHITHRILTTGHSE